MYGSNGQGDLEKKKIKKEKNHGDNGHGTLTYNTELKEIKRDNGHGDLEKTHGDKMDKGHSPLASNERSRRNV